MTTYSKEKLSASTNGRQVKVAATGTPGTTIHTASAIPGVTDEIYVFAVNTDTVPRELTIEWGGVTSPDDHVPITLAPRAGKVVVIGGDLLLGNATPLIVKAFCATANVIVLSGYVNRMTP